MTSRFTATVTTSALVVLLVSCNQSDNTPTAGTTAPPTTVAPATASAINSDDEMVTIAGGEFIMGSNKTDTEGMQERYGFSTPMYLNEHPQHTTRVETFKIDRYEVTNLQYKTFILQARGRGKVPVLWGQNGYGLARSQADSMALDTLRMIAADHFKLDMDTQQMERPALIEAMFKQQKAMDNQAVAGVSWQDAYAYCRWRSKRLPSEAEWERAARGTAGLEFPWGNEWDATITNTGDDGKWEDGAAPVGAYPRNQSSEGVYDLSGNVWEWVDNWYQPYPGSTDESDQYGKINKVIRGGGGGMGHYAISYFFRGATREFAPVDTDSDDIGFRCAKDI